MLIPTLIVPAMGGSDDDLAQTIQRCVKVALLLHTVAHRVMFKLRLSFSL